MSFMIRKDTLDVQIASIIKQEIIQGILKPGEKIDLKSLSGRFQISTIPIREALKRLVSEGFIESKSHRGYFVRVYTPQDIEQIGEARLMVEKYCLEEHFSNIDLKKLRQIYEEMQEYYHKDLEEYIRRDIELHSLIVNSCRNNFIIDFYNSLREKINFFIHIQEEKETFCKQHLQIIECILSKNKDQAARLLKDHILLATNIVKKKLHKV